MKRMKFKTRRKRTPPYFSREPQFLLLETNLGLSYMYFILRAINKRYHEHLSHRERITIT
jgi:hypothetical protein